MTTSKNSYKKINVSGVVQSVGFRPFIKNLADSMDIKGYVRNMGDAGVEIVVSNGTVDSITFLDEIKINKPELAVILKSSINEISENDILPHKKSEFTILKSSEEKAIGNISPLPPDIACCDDCITDLDNGRRKDYGFISCTNCGPRYTAIRNIPYDRHNTSFDKFPLCIECDTEYKDPKNRRFHAQTTCCLNCGPNFTLYVNNNDWNRENLDLVKFVKLLETGGIVAMMGSGGTHLVADAFNSERVKQLRREKRNNGSKPFAVMMKNIDTVEKYCKLTEKDKAILLSVRRPIVILPVKNVDLWCEISPGLSSLGVMLPYTSFHHTLFANTKLDVLLMTSANPPHLPMPITPESILDKFMEITDAILVHNREIVQRVDDSVIRSFGLEHRIIRRSRGYVPQPIFHSDIGNIKAIAFGGEENCAGAIASDGWIVPTQHLGHVNNLENLDFMRDSIDHLIKLYSLNPSEFVSDLHPAFLTTELAKEYSEKHNGSFHQVQHHVAHVASLGIDQQISHSEPILAWAVDGFGMSPERKAWGGELILIDEMKWFHKASTTPINYTGGDQNAIYPNRMLLEYLKASGNEITSDLKFQIANNLKNGEVEYSYIKNARPSGMVTTSLARLLDSISALLQISSIRSYRGEPAIKLEDIALKSKNKFDPNVDDYIINEKLIRINTIEIFNNVFNFYRSNSKADTAKLVHEIVGKSMAIIGEDVANQYGVTHVGFTGGVAYNKIINNTIETNLDRGISFLHHENIAPGDASIAIGQLNFLSMMLKNN